MEKYMSKDEAKDAAMKYIANEKKIVTTQEILDSGAVPKLKGFCVKPGKVSDSIFGGEGDYIDKKTGAECVFENPELETKDGIPLRLMVRTERISTQDVNRGYVPFKAQILAENHNYMRKLVEHAIGTSQFEVPGLDDGSIVIAAENLEPIDFENVLRAFMAESPTSTSLYQHFMKGSRSFCGHTLPENLVANGPLPYIMDTPSTKSDVHDESVSPAKLFEMGVCTPEEYRQIRNGSIFAFGIVDQFMGERGMIAVDTKTEHGKNTKGIIVSRDEIWTMDSSRFWMRDDYNQQMAKFLKGEISKISPISYSKEFARGLAKGDESFTEEQRIEIAARYIEGIQHLLKKPFVPDLRTREERIISGLQKIVDELVN